MQSSSQNVLTDKPTPSFAYTTAMNKKNNDNDDDNNDNDCDYYYDYYYYYYYYFRLSFNQTLLQVSPGPYWSSKEELWGLLVRQMLHRPNALRLS